jgi:hypothetical protein
VRLEGLLVIVVWFAAALICGYPAVCLLRTLGNRTLRFHAVELLFVSTLMGTLVIGWPGLVLAEAGMFSLPGLTAVLVLVLAGTLACLRVRGASLRPDAQMKPLSVWLVVPLFILAVIAFFHPHEFIQGGADAGVYVNLGANIARTGSLLIHEDGLTELPPSLWPALFRDLGPGAPARYFRLPGFYLPDVATGLVIPQFFALHPVWLAIFNALLGLRASLYVTPLWAALGISALALSLRRAFDMRVGALAGFLLVLTPTQLYFARYPTSEMLTQYLVWGGLFCVAAFSVDRHPLWGLLGGLTLGQVFLVRIDALLLLTVPLALLVCLLARRAGRTTLWFLVPFGAMLVHAVLHARLFSWPYTQGTYAGVGPVAAQLLRQGWWFFGVLLVVGVCLLWASRHLSAMVANRQQVVRGAMAGTLVGAGLFAYFVWPRIGQVKVIPYWYGGGSLSIQNHLNLVQVAWYLSPLGVWLGIAGMALMLLRGDAARMWAPVVVGLTFSVVYLYNIMNNPLHIYAMRRYVPVVFPFFAAGAAYALFWLWEQSRRWRRARAAGWLLGLTLVGWLLYNDRAVWNLVEYRGMVDQVELLASELEPGSVLLFEDDAPVGAGSVIGTPLQYVYGFTAFELQEEWIEEEPMLEAMAGWQATGRGVYWVTGAQAPSHLPRSATLASKTATVIDVPCLEQSYEHFPTRWVECRIPLEFHQVVLE